MLVEDHQELPYPNAGGKSSNVSQIRPYPVISNSNSLEDGEIVEGHFSNIASRSLSQQHKGQPQLHLSNQVRASTPLFPTAEPVARLAPTVEPSNTPSLS